jgi:hypothetical protein
MPLDCEPSAPGEICAFLRVCSEDAYCDVLDDFTCQARVAVGEACDDFLPLSTSCVSGASCNEGACTSYAREGESCAAAACDPALASCDPSTSTCRPLRFRGETCSQDEECAGGDCEDDGSGTMRCDGPCRRR